MALLRMKNVHIVIPDLFLPQQLAAYASKDMSLPALEKMLARAQSSTLPINTLESWLCQHFGVDEMAIAPLTLQADGLSAGESYWLRADPIVISMQRDQMVLQADIALTAEEAELLCASLNSHFAVDGLHFIAPHPQRWYLQLEQVPALQTHPLSLVVGADMNAHLPSGVDALRWHGLLNEIQMLFYEHAVNQAREQRGEAAVNGVWLWGGGLQCKDVLRPCAVMAGDSELAEAFAQAAGMMVSKIPNPLANGWVAEAGDLMVVWEGLRTALQVADIGGWRRAVQDFEDTVAMPLLAALASGQLERITLDILSDNASQRFVLTRASLWKVWRRPKPLWYYATAQHSS